MFFLQGPSTPTGGCEDDRKATTMTATTIHHPSCPARCLEPTNCPDEATGMPCNACWAMDPHSTTPRIACLCGPEAAAEDQLILSERTPDTMLLDIVAHADQAFLDFQDNAHGRRTPKGLLAAVLLDSEQQLDGPLSASWGVQA